MHLGQSSIFWVAFVVAALAAKPVHMLLLLTKSRQTIDPHAPQTHMVKQGTPTMGGIIVLIGLLSGLVAALTGGNPSTPNRAFAASGILLLLGFAAIGFVDDFVVPRLIKGKRGLGWRQKIVMQLVVAIVGLLPVTGLAPLPLAFGVFVILFCSNAYNFADGLDGLAGSIGLAYGAGLIGLAINVGLRGNYGVGALGFALAASLIPFLFLNAHPAKVFMGDVGSLPIGALMGLATLTLWNDAGSPPSMPLALVVLNLMLVAELVPVPLQVFYFKRTGKRIFPATPIHHGFEKKGWPETRVVAAFALFQLLASVLALTLVARGR